MADQAKADQVLSTLREFYTAHASDYAGKWANADNHMVPYYEGLLNRVPVGLKLLETGCGPGRDLVFFHQQGYEVTGTDYTPAVVEIAEKQEGLQGRIKIMDMRYLTFASLSFDAIWDNAAFHHIPTVETNKVIQGYNRVLKSGGVLFLRVKKGDGETQVDTNEYNKGETRFYKLYQEEELRDLLERNGFEILDLGTNPDHSGRPLDWIHVFAKKRY